MKKVAESDEDSQVTVIEPEILAPAEEPQIKPRQRLSLKQRKFIAEYIRTGNGTQSALAAYDTDSPKVAGVMASENLGKPSVRLAMELALKESNITPIRLSNVLSRHLDSARESASLKAVELSAKLMGAFPAVQVHRESSTLNLNAYLLEPAPVQNWIARTGKLPTAEERDELISGKRRLPTLADLPEPISTVVNTDNTKGKGLKNK